jgi:hypothetical protein
MILAISDLEPETAIETKKALCSLSSDSKSRSAEQQDGTDIKIEIYAEHGGTTWQKQDIIPHLKIFEGNKYLQTVLMPLKSQIPSLEITFLNYFVKKKKLVSLSEWR